MVMLLLYPIHYDFSLTSLCSTPLIILSHQTAVDKFKFCHFLIFPIVIIYPLNSMNHFPIPCAMGWTRLIATNGIN
jgi:hypothetical protein